MVRFIALWQLLPLALLPAAAALAWSRPAGVWDPRGKLLRPIAWLLVLWAPATWAFYAFNITGWTGGDWVLYDELQVRFTDFTSTVMLGRGRQALVATVYALWTGLGGLTVYHLWQLRRSAPQPPSPGATG
jgi:hypothetical protein